MELLKKANENQARTEEEKILMIQDGALAYGQFLTAMGFDWAADPHTKDTPKRVAKAWVEDLIEGTLCAEPKISVFPNDEGFTGLICQTNIPLESMCAHHNLPFFGIAHVAYIAGKKEQGGKVIGLSKIDRVVSYYAHRPNIQEALTKQIHEHINRVAEKNRGVAVVIESQHCCVKCRGIRHDSIMKTSEMSGHFFTNEVGTRHEFFSLIDQSRRGA